MNENKIKIKLIIDDKDVKDSDATIQRLEKSVKAVGLAGNSLNNIDKNLSDVQKEAKKTEDTISRLEKAISNVKGKNLSEVFNSSKNSTEHLTNVIKYKEELKQIAGTLKNNSLSQEQYNAQISKLSPSFVRALTDAKRLGVGIEEVGSTSTIAGAGMAAAFNPVTLAITATTVAVTGLAVGIIYATKLGYELSQSFAQYGSEIGKVQQITGLTAETLSALKSEAEATGLEFNSILDPITQFGTKIGDAAKGSKEAQKELDRFGIDGKKSINDLDGALQKAFTTINQLPPGIARISAANSIFGEEGTRELLPFIAKFDGDISNLTEKLRGFGLILSQNDVQASREFNQAMKEMQMEIRGVGLTLGRDLLPIAREVFQSLSGFYKENKTEIKEWSIFIADMFRGAVDGISRFVGFVKENWGWISTAGRVILGISTVGLSEVVIGAGKQSVEILANRGKELRDAQAAQNSITYQSWDSSKIDNANRFFSSPGGSSGGGRGASSPRATNEFRLHKDAEDVFKRFDKLMQSEPQFFIKLEELSQRLQTQPEWILNVLAFESRLKPNAKNPISSATGLIQAMDNGRKGDGIYEYGGRDFTRNQITSMSATEQLSKIIAPYFEPFKNRLNSQSAVYAAVAAGRVGTDDSVFFKKGSKEYRDNKGWDKDKDGRITQRELGQLASQFGFGSAYKLPGRKEVEEMNKSSLSTSAGNISTDVRQRELEDFQAKYILGLEEQYKISERSQALNDRQLYFNEERNARAADYDISLQEQLQSVEEEIRFQGLRNTELEKSVKLAQSQIEQQRELIDLSVDLDLLRSQNADAEFVRERQMLAARREEYSLQKSITDLQDELANQGKNDQLIIEVEYLREIVDLRNQETKAIIQTNSAQLKLSKQTEISQNQIRANVLSALAAQKDLNQTISDGILKIGESTTNFLNKSLGVVGEIPLIGDLLKFGNQQIGNKITTTLLDTLFPGLGDLVKPETNNPIARPITDKISESNQYLKRIADAVTPSIGGIPVSGGGGGAGGAGGGAGAIIPFLLNSIFGSNKSGNVSTGSILTPDAVTGGAEQFLNFGNSGGGGLLSSLGGLFGSSGSMWGGKFGFNSGTISGIGGLASLGGGLIGGGVGSILSGVGSGIGMASSLSSLLGISAIGGPIGLAIGATIGGVMALGSVLFGNSKQRKADEVTRTQAYQSVTQQFDEMIFKLTKQIPPGIDPADAMTRGSQLIAEYTQAMSQLKDKKTRNIALGEVTNANGIIYRKNQELQAAIAVGQGRLNNRNANQGFTGEFANGVFVDSAFRNQFNDFKRYQGLLGGSYTGKDYIKALIGDGEMVLTPDHRENVIRNAGFDPFTDAGIPNYKPQTPKITIPKFASGVSFASPSSSSGRSNEPDVLNFEFNFNGMDEVVDVTIRSEKNRNYIVGATKTNFKTGR